MRRDLLLLAEMRDAVSAIRGLVGDRQVDDIDADPVRRAALLWHFTVVGEAASQMSSQLHEAHPEIPWRSASRLRNRIVHGYWAMFMDVLIATAEQDLPLMLTRLESVIADMQSGRD